MQLPSPVAQAVSLPLPPVAATPGLLGPVVVPTAPEWGYPQNTADDSNAWQKALNSLSKKGGFLYIPTHPEGGIYRVKNLRPPPNVPITIVGESMTGTNMAPPKNTAGTNVWDVSGLVGTTVRFTNMRISGANSGSLVDTGILMDLSNGIITDRVWFNGLGNARLFRNASSGLWSIGCLSEFCGNGFNFQSDPVECSIFGELTYGNNVDLLATNANCAGLAFTGLQSQNAFLAAIALVNSHGFSLSGFAINGSQAVGVSLNSSNDAMFSGGVISGSATQDFQFLANTVRMFASNVSADFTQITAANTYHGAFVGGRRVVFGLGIPTLTLVSWKAGDEIVNVAPTVGQPKSWKRLTDGTANVLNTDWVSTGDL